MKKVFILLTMMAMTIGCFAQATKGYHGFADLGYTIGVGDYEFGRFVHLIFSIS